MSTMTLEARALRMNRILRAMVDQQMDKRPDRFSRKLSRKLQKQLDMIERLNSEQAALLLDILEAGVPDEFRRLLQETESADGDADQRC